MSQKQEAREKPVTFSQRLQEATRQHQLALTLTPAPKPSTISLLGALWTLVKTWVRLYPGQAIILAWVLFRKGKAWVRGGVQRLKILPLKAKIA